MVKVAWRTNESFEMIIWVSIRAGRCFGMPVQMSRNVGTKRLAPAFRERFLGDTDSAPSIISTAPIWP